MQNNIREIVDVNSVIDKMKSLLENNVINDTKIFGENLHEDPECNIEALKNSIDKCAHLLRATAVSEENNKFIENFVPGKDIKEVVGGNAEKLLGKLDNILDPLVKAMKCENGWTKPDENNKKYYKEPVRYFLLWLMKDLLYLISQTYYISSKKILMLRLLNTLIADILKYIDTIKNANPPIHRFSIKNDGRHSAQPNQQCSTCSRGSIGVLGSLPHTCEWKQEFLQAQKEIKENTNMTILCAFLDIIKIESNDQKVKTYSSYTNSYYTKILKQIFFVSDVDIHTYVKKFADYDNNKNTATTDVFQPMSTTYEIYLALFIILIAVATYLYLMSQTEKQNQE